MVGTPRTSRNSHRVLDSVRTTLTHGSVEELDRYLALLSDPLFNVRRAAPRNKLKLRKLSLHISQLPLIAEQEDRTPKSVLRREDAEEFTGFLRGGGHVRTQVARRSRLAGAREGAKAGRASFAIAFA